jgi:hypothetical protein
MLGLVSLKRTIDKARGYNAGTLGEYHYDCSHDKALFEFLGVDAQTFARKVQALETDDAIATWIAREYLSKKLKADIERFNEERTEWHPEPGSPSAQAFNKERRRIAPDRDDIVTWFDLLDIDEGRPVPKPSKLHQMR